MADTSRKIKKIVSMIEDGEYFTISKPRQYGKTTTLYLLEQDLIKDKNYLVLDTSFEGIDAPTYNSQPAFIKTFLEMLKDRFIFLEETHLADFIDTHISNAQTMTDLAKIITQLVKTIGLNINTVLMIDEVDKSSSNQLFLDFLGMLRSKYLKRSQGKDHTFHAVILAGVHDVKTLKSKIRPDDRQKLNSPWNIAVDFKVDLSLFPDEIVPMLEDYSKEKKVKIDIRPFADKLFYYTSGYPFLVSKLCKTIDEEILPGKKTKEWSPQDIDLAFQMTVKEDNTNFSTLIKNLENNPELYDLVFKLLMNEMEFSFNLHNPLIQSGVIYGILRKEQDKTRVHNRVYEQIIYNYMSSKLETSGDMNLSRYDVGSSYFDEKGTLNIEKVIRKFQQFMKEQYSEKDTGFIERNGRLLFLTFLKPIINGRGYDFKEVQVSEEKRLDIVITLGNQKYIIELKLWRGEQYHQKGIQQLCDYLDKQNQRSGYLLIFDLRKESSLSGEFRQINAMDKEIFAAWV